MTLLGFGDRLTLRTRSASDTRALAGAAAATLRAGDVVALTGELGAGKTCFVQGAATALGVTQRVTSPTFMLVKQYAAELSIVHCDVYRLDRLHEMVDLGEDVMAPDVVTFVEWGDAVAALLPDDRLEVELSHADDGDTRDVTLRAHGGWQLRIPDLAAACARWLVPGSVEP